MNLFLLLIVTSVLAKSRHLQPCVEVPSSTENLQNSCLRRRYLSVISLSNIPVFLERNTSGTVVKWSGPPVELLEQLSISYNFTYSIIPTNETTIEKIAGYDRGLADYILSGDADVLIGAAVIIASRFKMLDFTQPWDQGSVGILISPRRSNIVDVIPLLKPFQFPIWLALLFSGLAVAIALHVVRNAYSPIEAKNSVRYNQSEALLSPTYGVLKVLLGQGGRQLPERIAITSITGAWCLGACVLAYIYSSTLTTYLITTRPTAVVENVNDLARNEEIKLLVHKGAAVDSFLSTAEDRLYKKLNYKLNSYPHSRCDNVTECIDRVRGSQSKAHINGKDNLLDAIGRNFKLTGRCELQLAKEDFSQYYVSFALAKRSSYAELFNRGILDMVSKGIVTQLKKKYLASAHQCLESTERPNNHRLSFQNLSGAFGILLIGCSFSVIAFMIETLSCRFFSNLPRLPK